MAMCNHPPNSPSHHKSHLLMLLKHNPSNAYQIRLESESNFNLKLIQMNPFNINQQQQPKDRR